VCKRFFLLLSFSGLRPETHSLFAKREAKILIRILRILIQSAETAVLFYYFNPGRVTEHISYFEHFIPLDRTAGTPALLCHSSRVELSKQYRRQSLPGARGRSHRKFYVCTICTHQRFEQKMTPKNFYCEKSQIFHRQGFG
jgi:uncharacterized protein with PIN domain